MAGANSSDSRTSIGAPSAPAPAKLNEASPQLAYAREQLRIASDTYQDILLRIDAARIAEVDCLKRDAPLGMLNGNSVGSLSYLRFSIKHAESHPKIDDLILKRSDGRTNCLKRFIYTGDIRHDDEQLANRKPPLQGTIGAEMRGGLGPATTQHYRHLARGHVSRLLSRWVSARV